MRLWVAQTDYTVDQRIGPEILKGTADSYRRLRNTFRYMLGALPAWDGADVDPADMPELERWVLHRLAVLDGEVREGYAQPMTIRASCRSCSPSARRTSRPSGSISARTRSTAMRRTACGAGLPGGHGPRVPAADHLAGADPGLHDGGGLAVSGSRARKARSTCTISSRHRLNGATMRWPPAGRRSAGSAASSPARWRSSAARSGSGRAWRRRRSCTSPMPNTRALVGSGRFRRTLHHVGHHDHRRCGARRDAFRADDVAGCGRRPGGRRRARSASAAGRSCRRSEP